MKKLLSLVMALAIMFAAVAIPTVKVSAATAKEKRALEIAKEVQEEYHLTGWGVSKKHMKLELSDLSYFGYDDTFTKKEIDYAVKHCGINWKKEALYAVNCIKNVYDEYYDEPATTYTMYNDIAHLGFTKKELKWAFKKAGFPANEIKDVFSGK